VQFFTDARREDSFVPGWLRALVLPFIAVAVALTLLLEVFGVADVEISSVRSGAYFGRWKPKAGDIAH